ncbi:MAG: hypothetical protein UV73_C0014G0009 [Candidatus Gottesmanbacteria bacterium GW2011_GWA2_43_14]|uniref:Uncharacterized protein n=1 Tax=Candidatus Gottesmanbacteria bacterium GW2011_GWA2_43_14 TaxID=1618443 RepID=A0A0G1DDQ0_9BACT|nr:MAG: hypothetical protein UV73_C0014G0009 [Candidatus Gottesmanbacteria bacterium GW2011_GWA2_43_14]
MWPAIAALIASALGFTAGMFGQKPPAGNTPISAVSPTPYFRECYNPQLDQKITLTWPDNFTNLPDRRVELNPDVFGSYWPTFNANGDEDKDGIPECKSLVMNSQTSDLALPTLKRDFIKVRNDVRISSCKTDEQVGPFAADYDCGWDPHENKRGSCYIVENAYTDLRKIAETAVDGENREVFWTPFSYNKGCNFETDNNCGPGDWKNPNLKDFVYVLKKRDAYDKTVRPNCPALWDAGSTNDEACSHYFDVYLALDVYQQMQEAVIPADPEDPMYFLKNIMENCREQSHFTPVPDSILWIPPSFVRQPFLPPGSFSATGGKIIPRNSLEKANYQKYIWAKPNKFIANKTNLIKINERTGTLVICSGTPGSCYDSIGTIVFRDEDGTAETFRVYSQNTAPETFVLTKTSDAATLHTYMISKKDLPATETRRDPSLQLKNIEFISQNQWTWATPWCKPAIYLYPEKLTDLTVKLELEGELTADIPAYDSENGWQVTAGPDGRLKIGEKYYPYLYYEADITGNKMPEKGWVFSQSELKIKLNGLLKTSGFNETEISDFLHYWLPRLKTKPYYFVALLPEEEINRKEKLLFSRQVDTLIRTRVIFEGLDAPISIAAPRLSGKTRSGFVVADWGGTIIGESCSDWKME